MSIDDLFDLSYTPRGLKYSDMSAAKLSYASPNEPEQEIRNRGEVHIGQHSQ